MEFTVQAAANRERALARRRSVLPFDVEVANLVDCMVAFLGGAAFTCVALRSVR